VSNLVFNYTFQTNFIRHIGIHFSINNIFDEIYESNAWVYRYYYLGEFWEMDGYFPQAPVNFMGGVSFSF